jgi:lipid-binding SYLF domain-containing protein
MKPIPNRSSKIYSGAYASAAIAGSKISVDDQTMRDVYGPDATLQSVLNGAATWVCAGVSHRAEGGRGQVGSGYL